MKNVCILFSGGSYGTFIEWCLNYFSNSTFPKVMPFTKSGNAHNFVGNHLLNFKGCVDYVQSNNNFSFVRLHPKTSKNENILDNLKFINENFKKVVYLTPTTNTIAWNINNKFEKIWAEGWLQHNKELFLDNVKQWGDCNSIEDMELWELRELLSLFLYKQHLAETELENTQLIFDQFKNVHIITLNDLKDNFTSTIHLLLKYCELTPINIDTIDKVYNQWKKVQRHIHKDAVIDNIISSVLNEVYYDWRDSQLTLTDEALLQYYLRQHNIEIKCYKLNKFPTNSTTLREYFEYIT